MHDCRKEENKVRYVYALRESRWEFREYGERLPFEEVENYTARKIRDRLTLPMLERYCHHFGIRLLDPDFYSGDGYIIHDTGPLGSLPSGEIVKLFHDWPQHLKDG